MDTTADEHGELARREQESDRWFTGLDANARSPVLAKMRAFVVAVTASRCPAAAQAIRAGRIEEATRLIETAYPHRPE